MQYGQVTVSSAGSIVLGASGSPRRVELSNFGSATVYVGDRSVTALTGFAILNGGTPPPAIAITLGPGEELDAITVAGTTGLLHYLVNGN